MTVTPIGTDVVTSIARRRIMPTVIDNTYRSNPLFFRLYAAKRIVPGGTQIEVPAMYQELQTGGPYSGYEVLNVAPSDTVKNLAFGWKQHFVNVTVDGSTLIKVDSPESIANFLKLYFKQAQMQMAENLGVGIMSDGTNVKEITGLEAAVDDGGVAASYGGLTRASNTWLNSQDDSTSAVLTLPVLQNLWSNVQEGAHTPTLILSRKEQYNRYWNLLQAGQNYPIQPTGSDELLGSAGFTNLLFNNVPWTIDSHVFDGPNSTNSAILMLNEEFIELIVSPRADMYLQDFQRPVNQDAMVALILWAGNLVVANTARQGKLTNISG